MKSVGDITRIRPCDVTDGNKSAFFDKVMEIDSVLAQSQVVSTRTRSLREKRRLDAKYHAHDRYHGKPSMSRDMSLYNAGVDLKHPSAKVRRRLEQTEYMDDYVEPVYDPKSSEIVELEESLSELRVTRAELRSAISCLDARIRECEQMKEAYIAAFNDCGKKIGELLEDIEQLKASM